jgi:hypothetical protein
MTLNIKLKKYKLKINLSLRFTTKYTILLVVFFVQITNNVKIS